MYKPSVLRTAFAELVGILPSNLPQVPAIGAPLTVSDSGVYVQDKHNIVSLENVWYCAPDFNPNNYQSWVSGSNYARGIAVNYLGVLYISLAAILNDTTTPSTDPTNWALFNPFQAWLQQKYNQAVTNLFAEVIKMFKLQDKAKALLERQQLFRGGGSYRNTIIPSGNFVCFEVIVEQAEGLMVSIDQIGAQFTIKQALNIYVYHSSQLSAPIKTISIQTAGTSNGDFVWNDTPGTDLVYMDFNSVGSYFIGYFEADLVNGNSAISRDWDCNSAPCASCDGSDVIMYNRWSRYTAFRNIKITSAGLNGLAFPNLNNAAYDSNTNWGLNFSLTVRCDLSNFIVYSKFQYTDAFAMQLCLELMRSIATSTRVNPALDQIKNIARSELNVDEKSSFINQYWDSVRSVKIDMSNFSKSCQPCDTDGNRKKMTFRSI